MRFHSLVFHPSRAACAAAADPNAILLGGMWSPTTFPTRDPQWWHPSRAATRRACASAPPSRSARRWIASSASPARRGAKCRSGARTARRARARRTPASRRWHPSPLRRSRRAQTVSCRVTSPAAVAGPRGSCPPTRARPGGHGAVRPLQHSPRHLTGERARAADGGDAPQRAEHGSRARHARRVRRVSRDAGRDDERGRGRGRDGRRRANCARCFTVSPTSDAALDEDLRTRERERAGQARRRGTLRPRQQRNGNEKRNISARVSGGLGAHLEADSTRSRRDRLRYRHAWFRRPSVVRARRALRSGGPRRFHSNVVFHAADAKLHQIPEVPTRVLATLHHDDTRRCARRVRPRRARRVVRG